MTTAKIQAIETIDTRGNITRHAANDAGSVRCGWGGVVGTNHTTPTIRSVLARIQCGRCRRLVALDRRKLEDAQLRAPFKRRVPRLMI